MGPFTGTLDAKLTKSTTCIHRWKAFEAVLSCIGSVADELLESGEDDVEEVMQHINLDNMLTSVVPQLLGVSGKL